MKVAIHRRNSWTCRYCRSRTIAPPVFRFLSEIYPDEFPYHPNRKAGQVHPAYLLVSTSLDHVDPGAVPCRRSSDLRRSRLVRRDEIRSAPGGRRYSYPVSGSAVTTDPNVHRHGSRVHSHPHTGPHRHLGRAVRRSERVADGRSRPHDDHGGHDHPHDHGHSHGLIDDSIKRSREGIRAVSLSLAVLALAAVVQLAVFLASGSIALLADLIHNFGDALTAVPLGIAFVLRSQVAERRAGLAVVAAIFVSACVAGYEAVGRLIHPAPPTHLTILAVAGAIGYAGNYVASRIRLGAGRRLDSAALIADGHHARADAYVSLAVIASAIVVALGAPIADPLIGLGITLVILLITWQSWVTVRGEDRH